MNAIDTADLFAGPGGWSVAAAALGLHEAGFELDPWACATRAAAGHLTVRADVAATPTARMKGRIKGLIASPPCGTFSAAGKGEGVGDLPLLHQGLNDLAAGRDTRTQLAAACSDPRTPLVVEPLRYALDLRPEWIALEQVPAVLPLWEHIARILRGLGYSTWTGLLNAANYGVPQTRKRAILIASRVRAVAPPEPTHYNPRKGQQLWGKPWVSMAEALGWGMTERPYFALATAGGKRGGADEQVGGSGARKSLYAERDRGAWTVRTGTGNGGAHDYERSISKPAPTIVPRADRWRVDVGAGGFAQDYSRDCEEPSPTIRQQSQSWVLRSNTQARAAVRGLNEPASTLFFGARGGDVSWVGPDNGPIRIAIEEAAVLQSFPPDYPWQGTKTQRFMQVGNAVPPLLALHVLSAATGIPLERAA